MNTNINGIINVYKEKDYTSHDVVAVLRRILHMRKIGHTGTLDPMATGVLPVCIGNATKVVDFITSKDKSYRAKVRLGFETDTYDITGEIVNEDKECNVTKEEISQAVSSFLGESMQMPPMYSAIKVNGKKLYEYARKGQSVEIKKRKINITSINLIDVNTEEKTFIIDVTCSKGTYIRSLIVDIGRKLGTYACMEELERCSSGIFKLEDAYKLSEIKDCFEKLEEGKSDTFFEKVLLKTDTVFKDLPAVHVEPEGSVRLYNGVILPFDYLDIKDFKGYNPGSFFRVYDNNGDFKAIYELKDNFLKAKKMFL
jgi:tRNA pseudouridine55 synthase